MDAKAADEPVTLGQYCRRKKISKSVIYGIRARHPNTFPAPVSERIIPTLKGVSRKVYRYRFSDLDKLLIKPERTTYDLVAMQQFIRKPYKRSKPYV